MVEIVVVIRIVDIKVVAVAPVGGPGIGVFKPIPAILKALVSASTASTASTTSAALHVEGVFAAEAGTEAIIGNAAAAAGRLPSGVLAELLCLDTIAIIALRLIALLIPRPIAILAISILLCAITILILPVSVLLLSTITALLSTVPILLLCPIPILIATVLLLYAIAILPLRAFAILTISLLLLTVTVSIGLVLFPWFFLRCPFLFVLVILALHRECGGAYKQRQRRGCYQQLDFV